MKYDQQNSKIQTLPALETFQTRLEQIVQISSSSKEWRQKTYMLGRDNPLKHIVPSTAQKVNLQIKLLDSCSGKHVQQGCPTTLWPTTAHAFRCFAPRRSAAIFGTPNWHGIQSYDWKPLPSNWLQAADSSWWQLLPPMPWHDSFPTFHGYLSIFVLCWRTPFRLIPCATGIRSWHSSLSSSQTQGLDLLRDQITTTFFGMADLPCLCCPRKAMVSWRARITMTFKTSVALIWCSCRRTELPSRTWPWRAL